MKIAIYCHSISPSIDGVCRRFTSILKELINENNQILLFTLEDEPEDLSSNIHIISLNYLLMPAYPNKKVAKPEFLTFINVYNAIKIFQPDYIHITADGISQIFCLVGLLLNIPVLG